MAILDIGLNVFYFTKMKRDRKTSQQLMWVPLPVQKVSSETDQANDIYAFV